MVAMSHIRIDKGTRAAALALTIVARCGSLVTMPSGTGEVGTQLLEKVAVLRREDGDVGERSPMGRGAASPLPWAACVSVALSTSP